MHLRSPEVNAGFRRLLASITPPDAAPAPIIVCISSINNTAFSFFFNSFKSDLNRFSKSPRYLVPARSAPRSREKIILLDNTSGTRPSIINLAKPSATAVFPTPESPTSNGLFFLRRDKIWTTLLTSFSRPIKGSIFPNSARSLRLVENSTNGLF